MVAVVSSSRGKKFACAVRTVTLPLSSVVRTRYGTVSTGPATCCAAPQVRVTSAIAPWRVASRSLTVLSIVRMGICRTRIRKAMKSIRRSTERPARSRSSSITPGAMRLVYRDQWVAGTFWESAARPRARALRQRFEPRIDLAHEHLHALDRLVVVEKSSLAHDQEMPEAADVVVHLHDLAVDRIRIAREDQAVVHERSELRLLEHLE